VNAVSLGTDNGDETMKDDETMNGLPPALASPRFRFGRTTPRFFVMKVAIGNTCCFL